MVLVDSGALQRRIKSLQEQSRKVRSGKSGDLKPIFVEFLGLPPLISLLQCVNRLGFDVCSVNNHQTEQGSLIDYINLNWPRCSAGSQRVWH